MDFITEQVAIGTFLEGRDPEVLTVTGITAVLCLAKDRMTADPLPGIEKDGWPLSDGEGNRKWDLDGALAKLERLLARHDKVLVHCNAGKSRSCALVAGWL